MFAIAQRPRQVGTSLRYLPAAPGAGEDEGSEGDVDGRGRGQGEEEEEPYHSDNVPWQRVINARGMISHR